METKYVLCLLGVAVMVSSAYAEYYCGRSNACYMVPPGCAYGDCDFEVVWSRHVNDSTKYNFKIAARHDGWVAVGISVDKSMGSDDVLMCMADGDGAKFEHRFNNGRANVAGSSNGVEGTETRKVGGVISCRVERDVSVINNGVTFDLTNDMYMFFATGPLVGGVPAQHSEIPKITKEKVDFDELPILGPDSFEGGNKTGSGNGAGAQRAGALLVIIGAIMVFLSCGRQ